jgi:hypothetical protein
MTHEVVLQGYNVKPGSLQLGTFDSYGIEKIHVTADDEWAGLEILAVFHAPGGTSTKVVVGADGMLAVPPEATAKQAGGGRIVFAGLSENVQRITVDMRYSTKPHSDIDGDNPGTPTPDVVQQILANSNHAVSIATAAQEAAENARQAAEDAAKKAGEGAGGAAASAAAAKKSAEDAAASSESAAGKAEAAESSANAANESAKSAQTAQGSAENAAQTAADAAGAARQAAGAAVKSAEAAETAKQIAEDAAKKALEAKTGSENALQDAGAAKDAASGYADAAAEKATAAAASEKNAAKSENSAADSAAAAKKSAEDADNTANSIKDSMAQISENKEAVSKLKEDTTALQKRQNVLVGSETGNPISCNDAFSAQLCGLTVYGKSTQDGTPTPDAPVPIVSAGDSGSVAVKVTGKNLFYEQEFQEYFINSVANTVGLATGNVSCVLQVVTGAKYYVTRNKIGTKFRVAVVDKLPTKGNPVTPSSGINADSKRQVEISATSKYMVIQCEDEAAFSELMVSLDSSTTYSPYREQLLTLSTPNGLPGIPVTSGGNYTDQNGKQWICDEVDLERGVKVQRVYKVDVDGESSKFEQTGDYANLSLRGLPIALYAVGQQTYAISTFTSLKWFYNAKNGQFLYLIAADISGQINESCKKQLGKVYYALATPIETPLTPAEIAAYKALISYAPDTVVQASDGAGIKLDYQRDVNLVVKNLEDAIASMTTT